MAFKLKLTNTTTSITMMPKINMSLMVLLVCPGGLLLDLIVTPGSVIFLYCTDWIPLNIYSGVQIREVD